VPRWKLPKPIGTPHAAGDLLIATVRSGGAAAQSRGYRLRAYGGLLVSLTAAWLAAAGSAPAATIHVTAKDDSVADNGDCTLREAVISANEDRAVDACAKGVYIDTIQLESGNYQLSIPGALENLAATGDLDLTDPVELVGRAGETSIVAPPGDRVLHVLGVGVTVRGLTLTGGDVTAQGKTAYFEEGRGGGVLVQATPPNNGGWLHLEDSTISGNRANLGGGIGTALDRSMNPYLETGYAFANSTAEIDRSTISHNHSIGDGGAFYAQFGGATFRSSTVSENVAEGKGGGLATFLGGFHLLNSTIAHNRATEGGGFVSFGASALSDLGSTIGGSIVDGNEAGVGPDCSGVINSTGANVIGSTSGCELRPRPESMPDMLGVDPQIGPLANNGGPTETHAIGMDSPANNLYSLSGYSPFETYPFTCDSTDQRGEPRNPDSGAPQCDAGAFELVECRGLAATIIGTAGDDRIVGTSGDDVIQAASGNDRIRSSSGADVVCAGAGEDDIETGAGRDQIQAGMNNDTVRAGGGDDFVRGLQPGGFPFNPPKNVIVVGLDDSDTLDGGRGDDRILGEAHPDRLLGGPGRDMIDGGASEDACDGGPDPDRLRRCEKRES
jgi:CSLREA domain-containing protein